MFFKSFVIVLLSLPLLVYGEELTLKLVTDDNFPPYSYIENGVVKGFDIDVIKEIEKRSGYTFNIEALPWKRVLKLIETGNADGGFSLFRTDEREKWSYFTSRPIHYSRYNLFTKKGGEFSFETLEDLIGRKIGINSGFSISTEFDELKESKRINVIESEDADINFKLLKNGRIDVYASNYFTTMYKIKNNYIDDDFSMLPVEIVPSREAYLVISKNSTTPFKELIVTRINKIIEEMYIDGTIDKITNEYIGH